MQNWLEALARTDDPEERDRLLTQPLPADAGAQLHGGVLASLYNDRACSVRLSVAAQQLAELRGDDLSRAWAARAQGHVEHTQGDSEKALEAYQKAAALFEAENQELEVGRTLSSGIQALIFRGEYERAHQWAARAESIFQSHGDLLRLARLDSNVGNIFFRQDRPKEALARYQRALEGFEVAAEPRDIAAALSNLAVASTNLGQLPEALSYYRRAREICEKHGLANLLARADYNIAYLYYLRGDYAEARKLYQISRERSQAAGDQYHASLCDLDEAEMYLELNLIPESETMARRAVEGFSRLAMPYEHAKALVNVAVAASQRRDYRIADRTLLKARRLFVREKNPVWPALVDQLRAVLAFHELRFDKAQRLGSSAWRVLTRTRVPGRAAHCQILLARLWLRAGYADRARAVSRQAVERVGEDLSPSLRFHAHLLEGEIHELQGRREEALESYEAARREVEDMRGRVDTEDLRISILKDKLAVYEGLVSLCLDLSAEPASVSRALMLVQQAKSRSLADRIGTPADSKAGSNKTEDARLQAISEELNWIYRQIELATLLDRVAQSNRSEVLRERARSLETEMLQVKSRSNPAADRPLPSTSLQAIQSSLQDGELLLEYYEARGILHLFLVHRSGVEAHRLGPSVPVRRAFKLLQFQIGKFRLERQLKPDQEAACTGSGGLDAVSYHFQELYQMLVGPVEDRLRGFRHLIVAPHRELHSLPFAALDDGSKLLMERFTLSVAPSASVLARTRTLPPRAFTGSVVMAVPDPLAPHIEEEARVVARILPEATLLLGEDASLASFRTFAPSARIVHLAAHGIFRRDNPMFSAVQLVDSRLSLHDLNQGELNVDLLTLSACNTGSAVAVGGDELLGLMRGFLLAGARSLLVTLWEIDDSSTNEFMRTFYREVTAGYPLARAVQHAAREIRQRYPHPYYWAPFLLVGEPGLIGGGTRKHSQIPA